MWKVGNGILYTALASYFIHSSVHMSLPAPLFFPPHPCPMWKPPETNKKEWEVTGEQTGNTSFPSEAPQLILSPRSQGEGVAQLPLHRSRGSDPPVLYHSHWAIPTGYMLVGYEPGPKRF